MRPAKDCLSCIFTYVAGFFSDSKKEPAERKEPIPLMPLQRTESSFNQVSSQEKVKTNNFTGNTNGYRRLAHQEEDEMPRQVNQHENTQRQQQVQRGTMDLKKQQKHKEIQVLAADTYCRLLAQIEALFKKLGIPVKARHAEFDLNPPTSDVQDLMMGVEGFLNSLRIYNISVQKKQLDPLEYPAAEASIQEFKRGLVHMRDQTAKKVVAWVIDCLEKNSFSSEMPKKLSEAIMSDAEMAQHLDVRSADGITKMLGVQSDAHQLSDIAGNKLQEATRQPFDRNQKPVPLVTNDDIHNIKVRHYKQDNQFH